MVVWTPRARNDLKSIYDHIFQNSPFNAKKVATAIKHKADSIDGLPRIGKKIPELNDETIREVSSYSWRIIYHLRNDKIYILTVVHKQRQLRDNEIDANLH